MLFVFQVTEHSTEVEKVIVFFFSIFGYILFFAGRGLSLSNAKISFFFLFLLPLPLNYFKVRIVDFDIFGMSFIIPCIIFMIMPHMFMNNDSDK
jgi:hypothetical protein